MPADYWARAGAIIDKTFKVDIRYTGAGVTDQPMTAIRADYEAPARDNGSRTLRNIVFEIQQADLPERPSGKDTFTVGTARWRVQTVERRDDIGKWEVGAREEGAV
jgi:hypothetical protein